MARTTTAGFRFTIEAVGEKIIDRELLRMGEHAMESQLLMESLAEDFMNLETDLFNSAGASQGEAWPPLAASTIERKGHDTILVDTEDLKNSLTQRDFEGEAGGMILEVGPNFIRFGTSMSYAIYHQHGTSRMPQRKVIRFTEFWKQAMVKKIQLFIMRGEVAAL